MHQLQPLSEFFNAINEDPRINSTHISVYAALLKYFYEKNCENPISVFSYQVMQLAKISGIATYHKSIRDLNDYGYIKYVPSFNHCRGSLVYFLKIASQ